MGWGICLLDGWDSPPKHEPSRLFVNISSALDQPGRAVFHFQSSFIMKMLFVSVSGLSQTIREFSKDSSCENCKIENGNICYYSLRPKVGNLFNMNYEFGT